MKEEEKQQYMKGGSGKRGKHVKREEDIRDKHEEKEQKGKGKKKISNAKQNVQNQRVKHREEEDVKSRNKRKEIMVGKASHRRQKNRAASDGYVRNGET